MASMHNDLYLTSGTVGILNYWNPTVTKFDSSTFYNWEQDNEPIYDLEERTDYLWEKAGYPIANGFSGIPGRVFSVSADAPFAGQSSGLIFKSLSAVINTLPNPLTYPVIIEVASWGNLGELCIKNLKIENACNGAGLEIVNINHGRSYSFDPIPLSLINVTAGAATVSSTDAVFLNRIRNATSILTGASITSAIAPNADDRGDFSNRGVVSRQSYGINSIANHTKDIYLKVDGAVYHSDQATSRFSVNTTLGGNGGTYTYERDYTIGSYDVSTFDTDDTTLLNRGSNAIGDYVFASLYGNYLKSVKIENCAGPIYIRNFCVDGASDDRAGTVTQTENYGFEITNSNVILENSLALRCKKAGFKFTNSEIIIRRGLQACRNYEVSGGGVNTIRITKDKSYGVLAENSLIDLQVNSQSAYASSISGVDVVFQLGYNPVGLGLINSKFKGGSITSGTNLTSKDATIVQCLFNTSCGIELINSVYEHAGVTEVVNNYNGMEATNSKVDLPMFISQYNKKYGLISKNSEILINPNLKALAANSVYSDSTGSFTQFYFYKNGQHLSLNKSIFKYPEGNQLPSKFGVFTMRYPLEKDNAGILAVHKPCILINNSIAYFPHANILTKDLDYYHDTALFGACAKVTNNSNVKFQASKNGPTILLGPPDYTGTDVAVVHADNNSVIEFNGPTFIGQGGVDVLAENNSTIKFAPHTTEFGSFDLSGWSLDDSKNHTKVELHSLRSCLVVDKGSNLITENLGDFHAHWGNYTSSIDYVEDVSTSAYTSGGYLQFFTNGQDQITVTASATRYNLGGVTYNANGYFLVNPYAVDVATNAADHLKYSIGGVCVRALNGSNVKVRNVHFPAGWANTKGNYYDASVTNCEHLRIWNICGNSTLDVAYCSVSSTYPSLAGYTGPSANWVSGANLPVYSYPSGTPDTSTLAALDYYGASGATQAQNYGPFRLYFSPNSRAKFLTTSASNGVDQGVVYQMLAQGYNPSGGCSAVGASAVSSFYKDIVNPEFSFVSAYLDSSYYNRIRLDESAANLFCNAKHNAIQKSGRLKLVTIYRATASTEPGAQAFDSTNLKYGRGFKSAEIFDLRRDN